ncbi:MAG: hypothetical protein HY859_11375 [Caulobacterales bacterium]|nr:hypothetical protein [Caulobacterales bacterium]
MTLGALIGAELLNRGCFCITLDRQALEKSLDQEAGAAGFAASLARSHPLLFSNVPVFVPAETMAEMARVVTAVEAAALLPGYRDAALAWAPAIAQEEFGPLGALMGYDFHVTPEGPRLIEVNTNAGGAFLNAILARAQSACCAEVLAPFDIRPSEGFGDRIADMFVAEWRRQGRPGRPATIAIIDDQPEDQHLYPEFRLAKALLESRGFRAVIADPGDLTLAGSRVTIGGEPIDLVYNRLVDFALDQPRHAVLRAAYQAGAVVVTPSPRIHALLADKRNLMLLSDADRLRRWGLPQDEVALLDAAVPKTTIVTAANADDLWRDRRRLFFKPAGGHGSKAAYRGDKITRGVWDDILAGAYVAQTYAAPGPRAIEHEGARTDLKVDVRLYTYAGVVLLAAARLYQGQTTNMRTPGGGFAPVLEVPAALTAACT